MRVASGSRALHLVGVDIEARDGVGSGIGAEDEVLVGEVGIGPARGAVNPDHPLVGPHLFDRHHAR